MADPAKTFSTQSNLLARVLSGVSHANQRGLPWAADFAEDLRAKARGPYSGDKVKLITFSDLFQPEEGRNENGEMDQANLFFSRFGFVNVDGVVKAIRQDVFDRQGRGDESPAGTVFGKSSIKGVTVEVDYAMSGLNISYVKPTIVIDPAIELSTARTGVSF